MAYSDRITGTDLVVQWTPDGGSMLTITPDVTSFSVDFKVDTVDVTAGNEKDRAHRPTIRSGDWSVSMFHTATPILVNLQVGVIGTMVIYRAGTGSGKPLVSFKGIVTGFQESVPFDGAIEYEITGVRTGANINTYGDVSA